MRVKIVSISVKIVSISVSGGPLDEWMKCAISLLSFLQFVSRHDARSIFNIMCTSNEASRERRCFFGVLVLPNHN